VTLTTSSTSVVADGKIWVSMHDPLFDCSDDGEYVPAERMNDAFLVVPKNNIFLASSIVLLSPSSLD